MRKPPSTLHHAAAWSLAGSIAQQIIAFAIFIILARLLSPSDFGLMALAAATMEILLVLARLGIPELIINRQTQDHDTAFWLSLFTGIIAAALLLSASFPIATYFNSPVLSSLCAILSTVCILQGASIVHEARIRRSLHYKALTIRVGIASTLGGAVAIGLATTQFGVYALVLQRVVQAAALLIIAWRVDPWRPQLRYSTHNAWVLLTQGPKLALGYTLGYLSPKAVEFIIGAALGTAALGLYRVTTRTLDILASITVTPFTALALPALASSKTPATTLSTITTTIACLTTPLIVGIIAVSVPAIDLIFGSKWQGVAPILSALSPILLLTAIPTLAEAILTIHANTRNLLLLNATQLTLTLITTLLIAPLGLHPLALALSTKSIIIAALAMLLTNKHQPITTIIRSLPFTAISIALAAEYLTTLIIPIIIQHPPLALTILVAAVTYLSTIAALAGFDYKTIRKHLFTKHHTNQ